MELVKYSDTPACYKKYVYDIYKRTHPRYCHIAFYGEFVKDGSVSAGEYWDAVLIPDCPSGRIWAATRGTLPEQEEILYTRAAGISDENAFDVAALPGSLTMID